MGEKEVEWSVDMSEEAIKAHAQALPDDLKQTLVINEAAEDDEGGPSHYDDLGNWIQEQAKKEGSVTKLKDVDIYLKAKDLGIEAKHRTLVVLAQTLFDEKVVAQKQVEGRASLLQKMTSNGDKHEKAFLGGLERFVGVDHLTSSPLSRRSCSRSTRMKLPVRISLRRGVRRLVRSMWIFRLVARSASRPRRS